METSLTKLDLLSKTGLGVPLATACPDDLFAHSAFFSALSYTTLSDMMNEWWTNAKYTACQADKAARLAVAGAEWGVQTLCYTGVAGVFILDKLILLTGVYQLGMVREALPYLNNYAAGDTTSTETIAIACFGKDTTGLVCPGGPCSTRAAMRRIDSLYRTDVASLAVSQRKDRKALSLLGIYESRVSELPDSVFALKVRVESNLNMLTQARRIFRRRSQRLRRIRLFPRC